MKKILFIIIIISLFSCQHDNKNKVDKIVDSSFSILIKSLKDSVNHNNKPKIFFALDSECPLCTSYSHTINQLHQEYQGDFDFYAFFPSPVFNQQKNDIFRQKNQLKIPFLIDTTQTITHFLDAQVTPESFVLDTNLNIIYKGMIDDWVKELGRKSLYINNHYLKNAMDEYLNGQLITIKQTTAIGCVIQNKK